MLQKILIELIILQNLITSIAPGLMQRWTYEIVELTTFTSDPNLIDAEGHIVRLGRGKYGLSGFWNSKIDLYDDVLVSGTIERSKHRDGPYHKFPMSVENETLTNAMNKYYRYILQPTVEKCCINAPIITETFQPPLPKCYVQINNCSLETDGLPNILMEGYYKFRLTLFGPFEVYVESVCYVENKIH